MFIRPLLGKIQGHKICLSYYGPNDPLNPFPLEHDVALRYAYEKKSVFWSCRDFIKLHRSKIPVNGKILVYILTDDCYEIWSQYARS